MSWFFRAKHARFILGTSVALLSQVYSGNAQYLVDTVPAGEPLPGEEFQIAEPVMVQPMGEPLVGGAPVLGEVPLFPAETAVIETADGKRVEAVGPSRWRLLLGVGVSALYDDNIYLTRTNKEDDFIIALSPSLGVAYGDPAANYFTLTYSPSLLIFTDNSDELTVEHAVDLVFRRQTERWITTANFGFRALSGAGGFIGDREGERIGERVDRRIYVGGLTATYLLSDKTSIESGVAASYTDYDEFLDTFDIANRNFIDYQITGKTSLGLGFGLGYATSEGGPDQFYQQALARVIYNPTAKLTLNANGGAEFRQVDGGENQVNGIFGLGVTYTPFDNTILTLDGYRRIRPSSVVAEANYTVTGVVASVRQRFLGRFYVTLAGGYEHTEYNSLVDNARFVREENYFFVRPSLSFAVRERINVGVFYEHRTNDSNLEEFEFANNRVGVTFGVSF